jgi:hypothetical protein
MIQWMHLSDDTLKDLALVAALLAFSGVLVVAALLLAAWLRIDRAVDAASQSVGPGAKNAIAMVMGAGSVALLTGALPTQVLFQPVVGTIAAVWVLGSFVAIGAAAVGRSRPGASRNARRLQDDVRKAA